MDSRSVPRQPEGTEPEAEIPPLSGESLRLLYNARFADVISRLLVQSLPAERARERAAFLRAAARLAPARSLTSTIRDLHARLQKLASAPLAAHLDGGTSDGALGVVLLLSQGKAPSLSTVQRALTLHAVGGSEPALF